MSTLQKVKAYFGMVPLDPIDEDFNSSARRRDTDEYYLRSHHLSDGLDNTRIKDVPTARFRSEYSSPGGLSYRNHFSEGSTFSDKISPKRPLTESFHNSLLTRGDLALDSDEDSDFDDASLSSSHSSPMSQIITLRPRDYSEAKIVGERFRDGSPVIMDLTAMDNADAKRLVDFAAGLAFALHGTFDKVATKVFLLSTPDIEVSAEDRKKIIETGFYSREHLSHAAGTRTNVPMARSV